MSNGLPQGPSRCGRGTPDRSPDVSAASDRDAHTRPGTG
jgi:hypothetical protein